MEKSRALILVHSSMDDVHLREDVNVMLSPQFYTLKKEILPVKYAYQAKKIASALFEGLLEEGKEHEYMVWKEDDAWVLIAYDLGMISTFLEEKNFALERISKVFFTQEVESHFVAPLALGKNEALISLDKVIVIVPKIALDDECSLVFDDSFTPKKGIKLQSMHGSILTLKQTIVLSFMFGILALVFFIEGSRYNGNSKIIEMQKMALLESHPSLLSKYTRDSVMTKYKTRDKAERKKRETVKKVSSMIFKGVSLNSFEMNEKSFSAYLSAKDAKVFKQLKALAKKHNFKTVNDSKGYDLKIEGTL